MSKLVCFDVDGTLVNQENQVPDSAVEAVGKLRENGHLPVIATGRPPILLKDLADRLHINAFVGLNGQYASVDGQSIYTNPIDTDDLENLIETSYKLGSRTMLLTESDIIGNQFMKELADPDFMSLVYSEFSKIDSMATSEMFKRMTEKPLDRSRYENEDILIAFVHAVESEDEQYKEALPQFHFTRATDILSEVLPQGSSKFIGIKALAEYFDIDHEDIVTFGDSLNDMEMIQEAGVGVAMGNGRDELKDAADYVTTTVDENGIYNALQALHLIK